MYECMYIHTYVMAETPLIVVVVVVAVVVVCMYIHSYIAIVVVTGPMCCMDNAAPVHDTYILGCCGQAGFRTDCL
jgi:hypothetical protein